MVEFVNFDGLLMDISGMKKLDPKWKILINPERFLGPKMDGFLFEIAQVHQHLWNTIGVGSAKGLGSQRAGVFLQLFIIKNSGRAFNRANSQIHCYDDPHLSL